MPLLISRALLFLRALPVLHIALLMLLLTILALGFTTLPDKTLTRNEQLIIPDEILDSIKIIPIKSGDNFSLVASRAELSPNTIHAIMKSGEAAKKLLSLYPGQEIIFRFNKFDEFTSLEYHSALTETVHVERVDNTFKSSLEIKQLETAIGFAQGEIRDSLFLSANKAGMNDNLIMELVNILGWDIDFSLDIRQGDLFYVVFEEQFLKGKKVKNGNILVAQFINQGRIITAIRYQDSEGRTDYYTPEGLSMRKAFRRNPLDVVRITSKFNLNRKHPVLHKIRAHRGVDYAASTGTPVRATGDGKVISARTNGGFGKAVIIQHGQKYNTLYAHLSKYGKNIKEGRYVKQGQVIGYVGSTGLATGPHLHYEFRVNGVHRNPLTVELPHAKPISEEEKPSYLAHAQQELIRLQQLKTGQ